MRLIFNHVFRAVCVLVSVALLTDAAVCAAATTDAAVDPLNVRLSRAQELRLVNQNKQAREELALVLAAPNASTVQRAIAQLETAHSWLAESNFAAARVAFNAIASNEAAPAHLKEEAQRALQQIERRVTAKPLPGAATVRPSPTREFHVATSGNDSAAGTLNTPFATLRRAHDAVRELKRAQWPPGGVVVVVHDGTYDMRESLLLSRSDSGSFDAPVVYRAADGAKPTFSGGVRLTGFRPVTDASILSRLPEESRGKVMQLDLRALGLTNILPLELGGFGSGRGFKTHPTTELFFNGEPQQLARWPNDDFVRVAAVSTNAPTESHGLRGSKAGRFTFDSERPRRWNGEKDIWFYGYWFWDWADSYERVASIDNDTHEVTLAPPLHGYGFRKGQRFYALNLLSEIDQPGEWFLDHTAGVLYFWPPSEPEKATVEISVAPFTFVELKESSHVRFEGLTWDLGAADAIHVSGGTNVVFAGCSIQRFAGAGMEIHGGEAHQVLSCDISSLGRSGISMSGGDRKTLHPARHVIENCHIHDLSRIDHTYTPAIALSGVGNGVAHNLMHHIRSSAMRVAGNDHVIELNEMAHVVQESDDQGAVDMWGDPTFRGIVYRWNYFHHIGPWRNARTEPPLGQSGIRLDDAISGVLIYGNVFRHAATGKIGFGGVQIHGGKENIIDNNLFVDCATAVSFSPWPESHWRDFTKNTLAAREIDAALFTNRYPALARLNEDLNVNHLWRNQFIDCARFLHRNRAAQLLGNTQGTNAATELRALLMRAPDSSTALPPELRVPEIPFRKIGIRKDLYRGQIPSASITELRSDEARK